MAPICVLRSSIDAEVYLVQRSSNTANAGTERLVIYNEGSTLG